MGWAGGWGHAPGEAREVHRVGSGERFGARSNARFGQAVVHVMPREQAEAGVAVLGVAPGEEDLARAGAFWIAPKRSGKSGGTSAS